MIVSARLRSMPYGLVIDTNVLLDWLVFGNAACALLAQGLADGRLQWFATSAMHDEMAHVLARGLGGRWSADEAAWHAAWERHAQVVAPPLAPLHVPRCSDRDDQKFIDLAVGAGARWLLSRDRALLKLARRLRAYGVSVLTPEAWNASDPFRTG